jgi:hypothetical protein
MYNSKQQSDIPDVSHPAVGLNIMQSFLPKEELYDDIQSEKIDLVAHPDNSSGIPKLPIASVDKTKAEAPALNSSSKSARIIASGSKKVPLDNRAPESVRKSTNAQAQTVSPRTHARTTSAPLSARTPRSQSLIGAGRQSLKMEPQSAQSQTPRSDKALTSLRKTAEAAAQRQASFNSTRTANSSNNSLPPPTSDSETDFSLSRSGSLDVDGFKQPITRQSTESSMNLDPPNSVQRKGSGNFLSLTNQSSFSDNNRNSARSSATVSTSTPARRPSVVPRRIVDSTSSIERVSAILFFSFFFRCWSGFLIFNCCDFVQALVSDQVWRADRAGEYYYIFIYCWMPQKQCDFRFGGHDG